MSDDAAINDSEEETFPGKLTMKILRYEQTGSREQGFARGL